MDVLELPRPVINFLRTMAKESCRYVLSWDIFGGTDAVTLTLTWKLNDDQSEILKSSQEQTYDDLHIRHNDSMSSPHRSRRDETRSKSAIFHSSRGKSLENHNQIKTKPIVCHPSHNSSVERSSIITRQKKESDPIYANLCHVKHTTNPLPSVLLNNNPSLSVVPTHQQQQQQQCETPILRKIAPPIINETYSKLKRINHITNPNNNDDGDDDNTLDPWVKRFDCSLEDNIHETIRKSEDNTDKTEITSGKVKFKGKPDYF